MCTYSKDLSCIRISGNIRPCIGQAFRAPRHLPVAVSSRTLRFGIPPETVDSPPVVQSGPADCSIVVDLAAVLEEDDQTRRSVGHEDFVPIGASHPTIDSHCASTIQKSVFWLAALVVPCRAHPIVCYFLSERTSPHRRPALVLSPFFPSWLVPSFGLACQREPVHDIPSYQRSRLRAPNHEDPSCVRARKASAWERRRRMARTWSSTDQRPTAHPVHAGHAPVHCSPSSEQPRFDRWIELIEGKAHVTPMPSLAAVVAPFILCNITFATVAEAQLLLG
jgi:hypothetical protein